MFQFLEMAGNYNSRKVARTEYSDEFFISTAWVNDGDHDYETAIQHPEYNNGKLIIVEGYDSKEAAEAGHKRWEQVMTAPQLPDVINDCCNDQLAQFCKVLGSEFSYSRKTA